MTTIPANSNLSQGRQPEPHETYVHQHHWRNAKDEAEGAKLGMWLFLATEVLLFSGFFCAYFVYRMLHYETWRTNSHKYLDWEIGAANTVVLLLSSFTIVLAIRELQLARKWRAFIYLGITNLCAVFFLVVKLGWEYYPKWKDGKLPGAHFTYGGGPEASTHDQVFLSVYWVSTATHGLHVLLGVVVITWAMIKTAKGFYGPKNFMFVENTGLYWHIVDVIWIFLFPMLYLV
jgi:cytochrome c oxidase subunit 3